MMKSGSCPTPSEMPTMASPESIRSQEITMMPLKRSSIWKVFWFPRAYSVTRS